MKPRSIVAACLLAFVTSAIEAAGQTAPPAPALVEPANGASLIQPVGLRWSAVVDPDGPIGNYTWQVGTTSGFTVVSASGFTDTRNGDPVPTQDRVSGLPNGTYFWRVKATQIGRGSDGLDRLGVVRSPELHDHRARSRAWNAEHHRPRERIAIPRLRDLQDHVDRGGRRAILRARSR